MNSKIALTGIAVVLSAVGFAQSPAASRSDARIAGAAVQESAEDVETLRVLLTKELNSRLARPATDPRGSLTYRVLPKSKVVQGRLEGDAPEKPESNEGASGEPNKEETAEGGSVPLLSELPVLGSQFTNPGGFDVFTLNNATSYTRSFYAPGVGGWIDTSVTIPIRYRSVKAKSADDKGERDDAWNRAKQEVQGEKDSEGAKARRKTTELRSELDKESIEKATDAVVTVLAKYGARVRNLGDDESIVIALKLEGEAGIATSLWQSTDNGDVKPLNSLMAGRYYVETDGVNLGSRSSPHSETLIVRAPRALLESVKAGDIDQEAFRKRLVITRY